MFAMKCLILKKLKKEKLVDMFGKNYYNLDKYEIYKTLSTKKYSLIKGPLFNNIDCVTERRRYKREEPRNGSSATVSGF